MYDDGYAAVNLNFAFPFYDQTFNKAYMYDNGSLSFLQPNTQNALSPYQWNAQPISQVNAKYFITPLWADIAPVSQTRYIVDQTSTTAKFTWSNIAEYYSKWGELRLNTFSLQLDASGGVNVKYNIINLQTSAISVGMKGNTDYTQIAYSPCCNTTTSMTDWSNVVAPPPAPTPAVVKQEEPAITVPEVIQQSVAVSTPTTSTAATQQSVNVVQEPAKTETKKAAVKAQSVDMSVVDAAVSVAMNSASQSVNEQTISTTQTAQSSVSLFAKPTSSSQAIQKPSGDTTDYTQQSSMNSDKKDAMDTVILDMIQKQEFRQDQKDKSVNKNASTTTDLGPPIPGFATYATLVLPDVAFYAPKTVYGNQRVVDNLSLLRSLSNDARFERMIDQQYQR